MALNVSVVIVTRGDHDLAPIIGQDWPDDVQEIITWDNSAEHRRDLGVYGRYAAIAEASHPLIFVQDDDCTLETDAIRELIDTWDEMVALAKIEATPDPWKLIVANMPASRWPDYPDSCLVGWGAVFHREAPWRAFKEYARHHDLLWEAMGGWSEMPSRLESIHMSAEFRRTCDVVFTTLSPHIKLDLGFAHLPWAEGPDRMFKQPSHKSERDRMLALAREVRDAKDRNSDT